MKPQIEYEDFAKLDLRVLKIKSAEPHPNADKLLVLKLEGEEQERQIVAGIKSHYEPESLVGKQIAVIVNLKPVTLRGVESNGMLLAAEDSNKKLALMVPDTELISNAEIG
jgi:methionine--tRNA ligase beta chain